MKSYTIIILIFGIITMIILCLLFFINEISLLAKEIEKQFEPIKEYIEQRIKLLDKISSFITKNLEHEEELLKEIETAKQELSNIKNASDGINTLKNTEQVLIKSTQLEQVYKKIINNKEYKELIEEYKENNNRINYAIDNYDRKVRKYNNYKEKKIIIILNKIFNFPNYSYYKK